MFKSSITLTLILSAATICHTNAEEQNEVGLHFTKVSDNLGAISRQGRLSEAQKAYITSRLDKLNSLLDEPVYFSIEFVNRAAFKAKPDCSGEKRNSIVIGPHKIMEFQNNASNVLDILLAHELAHIIQYSHSPSLVAKLCKKQPVRVKDLEIFADFVAGFLISRVLSELQEDLKEYQREGMLAIASHSDYLVDNTQEHHGRVSDRTNALNFGATVERIKEPFLTSTFLSNSKKLMRLYRGVGYRDQKSIKKIVAARDKAVGEMYK